MEEREFNYINMIPFIDVMLVLLTIVLTTSTFVVTGVIPVELPKVTGRQDKIMKTNLIEIDRGGLVYFQGKSVTLQDLERAIRTLSLDAPFLIRADKGIALQSFVEVLELVKRTGFKKVSLQTEESVR